MINFEPNKLVKKYIATKDIDIIGLRGALIAIILSNRKLSNGEFNKTLKYLEDEKINIYEEFDGGDIIYNTVNGRSFIEDDYSEAIFNLKVNFCEKRINDVKNIGRELYGDSYEKETKVESTFTGDKDGGKKQMSHLRKVNQTKENNSIKIVTRIALVAAIAVAVGLLIKSMNQ